MSVTLEEVARSAGVSTATVARVIHSNGYVAEETRARVEAVIKATGYRPNAVARGLRKQKSFTLGHMLVEITCNPFFAHVARSVEAAAASAGYKTFSYNHNQDPEMERIGVERFIERRVDAMLLTYAVNDDTVDRLMSAAIPVVQIERERVRGTHSVLVNSAVGIRGSKGRRASITRCRTASRSSISSRSSPGAATSRQRPRISSASSSGPSNIRSPRIARSARR